MNPLIRRAGNNGYPGIVWTQPNTAFGSYGRDSRFRVGASGGAFVAQNTAPPYDTQIDLYSQNALTATPEFAGTDADVLAAVAEAYEWRISDAHEIAVSGVTLGTWNAFSSSSLTSATLLINDPILQPPDYTIQIREKRSGVVVATFIYNLDGF